MRRNRSATWIALAITAVTLSADAEGVGRPAQTGAREHSSTPQRGLLPLPTTANDFFQPGTQPRPDTPDGAPFHEFQISFFNCLNCHALGESDDNPLEVTGPYDTWATSLMAQSARDPVWQAALSISNEDAAGSGEYCIRCHAPMAWSSGRSSTGDMSEFILPDDLDAVSCHFCHRVVDPINSIANPPEDFDILQALVNAGTYPEEPGNGRFIFDPTDTRRGPEADWGVNMHGADILVSPHHDESSFCASCHDLSNPIFDLQPDGSYDLNAVDAAHPTQVIHDMFPEQRTYSEWEKSDFADGGIYFPDGRFGGDIDPSTSMSSCQDCHMPKHYGGSCIFWYIEEVGTSPDVPDHAFVGANNWVIGAVHDLYDFDGNAYTGLTDESVDRQISQTEAFLAAASDMDLDIIEDDLRVTITNWSGHKLPTGFPEGRRMWLNVQFLDAGGSIIEEFGEYDYGTADTDLVGTKVYEMKLGLDAEMATATGLPEGETFHITLANSILKDNRIPPAGFTNAAFEEIDAAPVAATYADYQHWDETYFSIPVDAEEALVTLLYQTSTKEYMEFLRDTAPTGNDDVNLGHVAYDAWVNRGRSTPVIMDSQVIEINPSFNPADVNQDGEVDVNDLLLVIGDWGCTSNCTADIDGDGNVNVVDLLLVIANWGL